MLGAKHMCKEMSTCADGSQLMPQGCVYIIKECKYLTKQDNQRYPRVQILLLQSDNEQMVRIQH